MRWIADDPDPATRAELQRIVADALAGTPGADDELADRMRAPLRFGTAGLRGPVRAGPAGMNVAVVRRTTAALAQWLRRNGHAGATVVVGRDARHGSPAFAAAAAGVLGAAGFDAVTLPGASPTPLLAFAVRHLGAVAGVQVTASHNPASDNGYKVYLGDGAQLVPPVDAEIEDTAEQVGAAVAIPADGPVRTADPLPSYLERVAALPRGRSRALRIALTPLHGVGGAAAVQALALAGFTDVHVVSAQAVPDPDFPTVSSPNPEHLGTTDALLALASSVDADLAVALDPDADRCALGVPGADGWRMLTGDDTGVLLGDHLLRAGTHPDPLVATTVVSSSMLRAVAASHGARSAETLTGFKWIVRAGAGLVYGYEEALGYCVDPDAVRDKDGIAAAVVAADLAATLRAGGSSLAARLDELAAAHGVHATAQLTVPFDGAGLPTVFGAPPAGWDVARPAPDVLVLRRDSVRVVVRPSGTEPILKTYLEVVEPPDTDVATARTRAAQRMTALAAEVREW
ncbi:phospho-sugar mutase [Pseudonocardia sp.]|uniref:phospho-sugar mutase n=1 Tax=Pseudonocardia sp. TaxID=60912 RepID=UPI003D0C3B8B